MPIIKGGITIGPNMSKKDVAKLTGSLDGKIERRYDIKWHGKAPDGWKPGTIKTPKVTSKPEKVWTAKTLKDLNKSEQVAMLEELGAKSIPRLESGRVKLILELMK